MRFGTTHWRSPTYPDEYVTSLKYQFAECGHHLHVLGNGKYFDDWLRTSWLTGWGAKIEWFAPYNAHLRPAVVFDLDTFVVGDLNPFLDLDGSKLWLIRQFMSRTDLGESGIFVAPDDFALCQKIWERANGWDFKRGDGALLREFPHEFIPDVVDGIYSYKAHGLGDKALPPDDARVICFHGKPKPPDTAGWAYKHWQTSLSSAMSNYSPD